MNASHSHVTDYRLAQTALAVLIGMPLGVLIAWLESSAESSLLERSATAMALLLPAGVAGARLRRSVSALPALLVGGGILSFFLPGVLSFDPGKGLIAAAGLTPQEARNGGALAELVLVVFALAVALSFATIQPQSGAAAGRPVASGMPSWYSNTLRSRAAMLLGVLGALAGLWGSLRYGVEARTLTPQTSTDPAGLLSAASTPVPAAFWLAGRRGWGLLLLAAIVSGAFLEGGRQAVTTPLVLFLVATAAGRRDAYPAERGRRWRQRSVMLLIGIAVVAVVTAVTITTRSTVATAVNGGVRPSVVNSVVTDQSLFEPLVVAVAREGRPQWFSIYARALAAPVPRFLWKGKPLSYDYDFRLRHFPQYDGGIPISLVGTAFLSFLLPGVVLAGLLVGAMAAAAGHLLSQPTQRSVLLAGSFVLLTLDVVRIGGFYREVLTFVSTAAGVLLITCPPPATGGRAGKSANSLARLIRLVKADPHAVAD